jgi:hypothetical protein
MVKKQWPPTAKWNAVKRFSHKTKWKVTAIKWKVTAILKRGSYPKEFPHKVTVGNVVSLNCLDEQTNDDNTQDVAVNSQPRLIHSGNSARTNSSSQPRDNTAGNVSLQWTDARQMVVALVGSSAAAMHVVELPLAVPPNVIAPDFTFTRAVINCEVRDDMENTMPKFDPPIRLYLAYTRADLATAGGTPYSGGPGFLSFEFWDEQRSKWVTFEEEWFWDEQNREWESVTKTHHLKLLHAEPGADGIQFYIRQNNEWQSLSAKDGVLHIGDDLDVPVAELQDVALVLQGFPDVDGFAFVQVDSWDDRLIGVGISSTRVIGAGGP